MDYSSIKILSARPARDTIGDRRVAKEKVPEATEAKIPPESPNATEIFQLCENGTKLSDGEEPEILGNPERAAEEKYSWVYFDNTIPLTWNITDNLISICSMISDGFDGSNELNLGFFFSTHHPKIF
jgi:hypothetical protein